MSPSSRIAQQPPLEARTGPASLYGHGASVQPSEASTLGRLQNDAVRSRKTVCVSWPPLSPELCILQVDKDGRGGPGVRTFSIDEWKGSEKAGRGRHPWVASAIGMPGSLESPPGAASSWHKGPRRDPSWRRAAPFPGSEACSDAHPEARVFASAPSLPEARPQGQPSGGPRPPPARRSPHCGSGSAFHTSAPEKLCPPHTGLLFNFS